MTRILTRTMTQVMCHDMGHGMHYGTDGGNYERWYVSHLLMQTLTQVNKIINFDILRCLKIY